MSFPRYERYKESGVEWLGEVPVGWEVKRLKHVIEKIESGTSVNASDEPAEDGYLGVLKTSCVYTGQFDPCENKTVIKEDFQRVSCPLVVGTLIVSRMNTPELVGAAGLVKFAPNNLYLPDRLWQVSFVGAEPSYVHYWTLTNLYRGLIRSVCAGTSSSMQNLGQDQFRTFPFPLPPLPEQHAIAAFLDRETGKIDALVAEQERLIALLKEQRQAVISHAVTKGLNPDAPMKDSGIEWLGEVPMGWEVVGITKYLESLVDYRGKTPTKVDDGVFLVTARNIKDGSIDYQASEEFIATAEYEDVMRRGKPAVGDVVLTTEAPLGQVANLDRTDIALAQRVIKLRGQADVVNNYYLKYWILGEFCQADLMQLATGSTALGIKGSKVVQIRLCLPPPKEQSTIVTFLDSETAKIDRLVGEAQQAIGLLKERRSALISAAVTGKIDVRKSDRSDKSDLSEGFCQTKGCQTP